MNIDAEVAFLKTLSDYERMKLPELKKGNEPFDIKYYNEIKARTSKFYSTFNPPTYSTTFTSTPAVYTSTGNKKKCDCYVCTERG